MSKFRIDDRGTGEPRFFVDDVEVSFVEFRARCVVHTPEMEIEKLRSELAAALAKADQYKADWYAAKSEFGTAIAKMKAQRDEAIARAARMLPIVAAARQYEQESRPPTIQDEVSRAVRKHFTNDMLGEP